MNNLSNLKMSTIVIPVDGRTLTLQITLNAMCALEQQMDPLSFNEIVIRAAKGSAAAQRGLIWAALQKHHKAEFPDVASVNPLIDEGGGLYAWNAHLAEITDKQTPTAVTADPKPSRRRGRSHG